MKKVLVAICVFLFLISLVGCINNLFNNYAEDISFEDSTFLYTGKAHSLRIHGSLPDGMEVNYTNNNQTEIGTYEVTASFVDTTDKGRKIKDMVAILTIDKGIYNMNRISFENEYFTYDGKAKSLSIRGTLPEGVSVDYINNNQTNIGEYEVIAVFSGDSEHYQPIEPKTASLIIYNEEDILNAPNVTVYNGYLKWNSIPNALQYVLSINNEEIVVEDTTFVLLEDYIAGEYSIKIKSISEKEYLNSSYSSPITVNKLDSPSHIRVWEDTVRVYDISHATGYELNINGNNYYYEAQSTNVEIFSLPEDIKAGPVDISIMTIGDSSQYLSSDTTPITTFYKLDSLVLDYKDECLCWNSLTSPYCTEYIVYIDDEEYNVGKATCYRIGSECKGGKHKFQVRAIGENTKVFSSYSNTLSKSKLYDPGYVRITDDVVSWYAVKNATGYRITCTDGVYEVDSDTLSYNVKEIRHDIIYVQAIGDDDFLLSNRGYYIYKENNYSYINYGSFPQSVVTDKDMISNLESISQTNDRGYLEYGGEEYLQVMSKVTCSSNIFHNNSRITPNTTYYCKVEPIKWRLLKQYKGCYVLLSEYILDNQVYDDTWDIEKDGSTNIYSNNYEYSYIRKWLNNEFYNSAFSDTEKLGVLNTTVDNSVASTGYEINYYHSRDTIDKVYLISYQEIMEDNNLSKEGTYLMADSTDYARLNNCSILSDTYPAAQWWLRSCTNFVDNMVRNVNYRGKVGRNTVDGLGGPRPMINIR